jgi:DNA-binding SARP family transcriptional activator/tetratricopeptide (TPR) repeat protein
MEFRILGPLYADAGTGNGPAMIRQPLLQSALAVLLLRANRPCPRNWLIQALWGAEPPGSPEASLRVCVSRLRQSLGDCATRLDSVGPPGGRAPGHRQQRGYLMAVRPGELDLDEFNDLAAQGQAELDLGNAAGATTSLTQALTLWADPPLPDLPDTPLIAAEIAGLTAQRTAAADALVDARLAAGEHDLVLGQLRAAVLADPGRERSTAQMMRVCHATGLRKEALDVYQRARRATLEEQGIEPGPVLAVLHRQILAEELAAERSVTRITAPSRAAAGRPAWQVPAPPADFTGRADEIARISDYLAGPAGQVTVVTGGPGTGKTAVAAAAALALRDRFPDGQLYAELGGVAQPRDPLEILTDMLLSLGVPARSIPPTGPARAAMYRSLLADQQALVVADDAAAAAQVRPLLPGPGGAGLLVTSRGRLSGLAGARIVELGGLPSQDALTLLSSAAGPARTVAEPEAARAVVAACDGLPLAMRLAGAALTLRPGLTVAGLARDLTAGRTMDVLAAEDTSVRESIGSSYRSVSAAARAALTLAVTSMPEEIPGWALTELADGDRTAMLELAAVGLVAPAPAEVGGARFRVHPLTRAYAIECDRDYAGPGTQERMARLRAGWLVRAAQAAAGGPALPFLASSPFPSSRAHGAVSASLTSVDTGPGWLASEQAGLLAVAAQACDTGDHVAAAELAAQLLGHQCAHGSFATAIGTWRSIVTAAAVAHDVEAGARASYCLAFALAESHQVGEAAQLLTANMAALERASDQQIAAMAIGLAGRCHSASGRHAAAMRAARSAMRLAGDRPEGELTRCAAQAVLGLTLGRIGILSEAEDHCRQSRQAACELSQPAYESAAVRAQAQVLILGGQYAAAERLCDEGITLARSYGSEITAARFMLLLGRARQLGRDPVAAISYLRDALDTFRNAGSLVEELTALSLLTACTEQAGQAGQAAAGRQRLSQFLAGRELPDTEAKAAAALAASKVTGH